jgi:hypothetical protein
MTMTDESQGSYPREITRDQFDWLQERAAANRKRWAEHARALVCDDCRSGKTLAAKTEAAEAKLAGAAA